MAFPPGDDASPSSSLVSELDAFPGAIRVFGDYELLELLGRGGMGVVYKARQSSLDRITALKMIRPEPFQRVDLLERFHTEAQTVARLQHSGIVSIYEVGEVQGQPYFSMEYVEGESLAERIRVHPLPPRRAAEVVQAVAEAIHYAHQQGVLHRDLKPSNILLNHLDQPKVTDFGVAKLLTGGTDLTLTGQPLGSPNYMAPEQAAGRGERIDPRTDVYALGAVLYHLISGRPPFIADTVGSTLAQVATQDPIPLRRLLPALSRDLETICLTCLEKEPRRRYASAHALAGDLGRFLRKEPIRARPVRAPARTWRWCCRKPAIAGLLASVICLVLAGMAGTWAGIDRIQEEQARTRRRLYVAEINLAQQAFADGQLGRALDLLGRHRPGPDAPDYRGWEWRHLWQQCQGDTPLTVLDHLPGGVYKVAVSPEGNRVAASSRSGQIGVWDLARGKRLADPQAPGWQIRPWTAWSPDGRFLLFFRQNLEQGGTFRLWDVRSQNLHREFASSGYVNALSFAPNGRHVAMFSEGRALLVWDLESGQVEHRFETAGGNDDARQAEPVFSPDGTRIYAGASDGWIRCWSLENANETPAFAAHTNGVKALAISPNGRLLASVSGGTNTVIRLWDSQTGEPVGELAGHPLRVAALSFSPDGTTLASASADQTIRLWDVATRSERRVLRGHRNGVRSLAWFPDGRRLISGCGGGDLVMWDTDREQLTASSPLLFGKAKSVALPLEGKAEEAVVVHASGEVALWDALRGTRTKIVEGLGSDNACAAYTPDGTGLVAGDTRGRIKVWDLVKGRMPTNWQVDGTSVAWVWFTRPPDSLLCTVAVGKNAHPWMNLQLWEPGTWQMIGSWPVRAPYQASWRGRYLARGRTRDLQVIELATGEEVGSFSRVEYASWCIAFSPDEKQLALASTSHGTVVLWDLARKTAPIRLRAHIPAVHWAVYAPGGRRLALGVGPRHAITFWDIESAQEVYRLDVEDPTPLAYFRFYGDGNCLLAGTDARRWYLWRAPSFGEIEAAEQSSPWRQRRLGPAPSPGE